MVHIFYVNVGGYSLEKDFLFITPHNISAKRIRHLIADRINCCEKSLSFYFNTILFSEIHNKEFWDKWANESMYILKPFDYNIVEESGISGRIYLIKKFKTD